MRPGGKLLCAVFAGAIVLVLGGVASAAPTGYDISTGPGELNSIDLATGAATVIGVTFGPNGDAGGVAFRADGTLFAINELDDTLHTVDLATGTPTLVGALGVDVESAGLTFGPDGRLWMADSDTGAFWEVDPATGVATEIGPLGIPNSVVGLAATCDGTIYGIGTITNQGGALFTMDTATGAATLVGPTVNTSGVGQGLAFDADGVLWASAFGDGTYTVEPATGVATPVAVLNYGFEDLAITPLVCGEPPTPPTPEPVVVTPTFTG